MNLRKLYVHNSKLPLEERISISLISRRVAMAQTRGMLAALFASIHAEVDPKIKEKIKAEENLGGQDKGRGRGRNCGKDSDSEKSKQFFYPLGKIDTENLAVANEPNFETFRKGSDRAIGETIEASKK